MIGVKQKHKMSELETANKFSKQKRKKRKYKLTEAENMPEAILESNKSLDSTVQHDSMEYREPGRCKTKSSRKKKVTDFEIIESTNDERSDIVVSNKFHKKKRKHKVNNAENLSGSRILEVDLQDSKNDTSIETPKELKHSKKHKLESPYEMGNVSNTRIKESSKTDNKIILDELYKRKGHYKQIEFDNVPDSLSADLNEVEVSQNNLNNDIYKRKKKRHKCVTLKNLQKISNVESNRISYSDVYHKDVEESIVKNLERQSNFKLNKKYNKNSEIKTETHQKRKRGNINDTNEFDCKIVEPAVTEKLDNSINSIKFHKKKRKHKVTEDKNISECEIAEMVMQKLESNTDIKYLGKQKKKEGEHNFGEMENVFIHRKSAADESEKNIILDVLAIHKRKNKHKQIELGRISDCEISQSSAVELNQNGSNKKNADKCIDKKKKKCNHKSLDEIGNMSNYKIACSNLISKDQNNSSGKNIKEVHQKKYKSFDEMGDISDCKAADSNSMEINWNDLNSKNVNIYHENKKKHKLKSSQEVENISDYKTADSNPIEINRDDLNCENVNRYRKKKKKKSKNELLDEMKNISDSIPLEINQNDISKFHKKKKKRKHDLLDEMKQISDSNLVEINRNDISKFHKKKQEHKLFSEMENKCNDHIQETSTDKAERNGILDTLHVKKKNKSKPFDLNEMSDQKTTNTNAIEINQNDLSIETSNQFHKAMAEVEIMPKTVTELNNTSSNIIYYEHTKKDKVKNMQNLVDISTKTNKEKTIEILSDNLKEKENSCKEPMMKAEVAYSSFDPFINDMTDVPVSFPVPILHESEAVCSITQEKRAYLEKNGVTIQTGKWTKTEDDILTRNFQQFGLEFGVNDPFQLLGINQVQKNNQLDKFKKAKHFLIRLGKDLSNRSLRSIYMRARKLLTPLKIQKKLSPEEAANLKHAHQLVGNKWTRISDMLSRSDHTCHTAFRWHKSDINKGKWTPEEECNLIKAIKTVSGSEDISVNKVKNISWKAVAKYLPTRNEFQCHKQWAEHLAWDSSVAEKKRWDKYYYGKLIYLLKEKYCFNSEYEIDWKELHKHFIDVAPSYIFLHKKWFYLKGRLPKNSDLSYSKCLDSLKRMYEEEYKTFSDV